MVFASFCVIDLTDGAKIEGIGDERVEGVGWNCDDLAEANCGFGAI
jgi:hypothetical protein